MGKNLMTEVAALLGVEIREEFIIQNADREETVVLAMDGLHVIQPNDVLGPEHGKLLSKVLQGLYEVVKLPWKPKEGDKYYSISLPTKSICVEIWHNETSDYALKALGMIYRTEEEAKAHMAEDYMKLTGKKLEG